MTATAPSPRESRRAERIRRQRDDVLAAASEVFANKGFDGAQMGEIARRAELSLATVYGMFPGKSELYSEVVADTTRSMRQRITESVEPVTDPGERLMTLIDALLDCYQDNQAMLRIYVRATQGLPYKIRESLGADAQELFQSFARWVAELAQTAKDAGHLPGLDPEIVADALVGTVTTYCAHWVERENPPPLTDAAPAIRALFARVIGDPR